MCRYPKPFRPCLPRAQKTTKLARTVSQYICGRDSLHLVGSNAPDIGGDWLDIQWHAP